MRNALLHGATSATAATYALTTPLPEPDAAPDTTPDAGTAQARTDGLDLPLPRTGWQARGLARAATALDAEAVRGLLNESITAVGAQVTWDAVVRPVLAAVGQRWADTGTGIEIEHLLSDCVTGVFSALAASTPTPATTRATTRPVLLAGMADDQHRLPIVVLSATLAQRGVACRSIGRRPARRRPDRSDPPHRTRSDTAVVTTARHRRPRPAHVPSPHPTRLPHLRRRPRLGRHRPCTTDRAAQLTPGSHQHARRIGCDAGAPEPLGNPQRHAMRRPQTPVDGGRPAEMGPSPGSSRKVRTGSSSTGGHAPPRSASAKAVWVTRESRYRPRMAASAAGTLSSP